MFSNVGFQTSNNNQKSNETKKSKSSSLSKDYIRSFNRLTSLPSLQTAISNKSNNNHLVTCSKISSANIWFMLVRLGSQCQKHESNGSNSRLFVWNTSKNSVHSLKVPFRHNVCRCRIRVSRNIIIRMSQQFRLKIDQISCPHTQSQRCNQIFCIKIWIKVDLIALCINTQRVSRSVLVQSSKMNQTQSSQLKGKKIMKTVETIQSRIIYTETSPQPSNNTGSYNRQSTCQRCNYSSSPKRHLQILHKQKYFDCTLSTISGTHR